MTTDHTISDAITTLIDTNQKSLSETQARLKAALVALRNCLTESEQRAAMRESSCITWPEELAQQELACAKGERSLAKSRANRELLAAAFPYHQDLTQIQISTLVVVTELTDFKPE
jgi:hypothetical protein